MVNTTVTMRKHEARRASTSRSDEEIDASAEAMLGDRRLNEGLDGLVNEGGRSQVQLPTIPDNQDNQLDESSIAVEAATAVYRENQDEQMHLTLRLRMTRTTRATRATRMATFRRPNCCSLWRSIFGRGGGHNRDQEKLLQSCNKHMQLQTRTCCPAWEQQLQTTLAYCKVLNCHPKRTEMSRFRADYRFKMLAELLVSITDNCAVSWGHIVLVVYFNSRFIKFRVHRHKVIVVDQQVLISPGD